METNLTILVNGAPLKTYNKLVRDRIPNILKELGKNFETQTISGQPLQIALEEKLIEELSEFKEDHSLDELADLLEVVFGLAEAHGFTQPELEASRRKKHQSNGGFSDGIYLLRADP